jgi:hypothetical protein
MPTLTETETVITSPSQKITQKNYFWTDQIISDWIPIVFSDIFI